MIPWICLTNLEEVFRWVGLNTMPLSCFLLLSLNPLYSSKYTLSRLLFVSNHSKYTWRITDLQYNQIYSENNSKKAFSTKCSKCMWFFQSLFFRVKISTIYSSRGFTYPESFFQNISYWMIYCGKINFKDISRARWQQ